MSYQVIARKWRPQTFDDIVGQKATAQTLRNSILQNRIAHAYLFAGSRGVGKTSTARILAKALNCIQGPTVMPCNLCDSCREITAGNSIDVLEIDAASNRGIDEIRELRENVKYAAARDRYKVFIIDEVHMLTTEAFNALLKTLEEPPAHVVFVLATTELHKVPSTILSRCQHFNFRGISYKEILDRLSYIASQEQIQIGDLSLNAIARASEGSMRDAQSLMDQIISFCGKEVNDEQVRDLLGIIPQQLLEDFTSAILESNPKRVVDLVEQLVQSGLNLQHFVREMLAHFRNLLIIKIAGEDSQLVPLAPAEMARCREFSRHFSEEDLTRFFNILVSTESELKWSSQPRFHLEIGLMKIVQARRLLPIESLIGGLEEMAKSTSGTSNAPAKVSTQMPKPPVTSRFTASAAAKMQLQTPPAVLGGQAPAGVIESLRLALSQRSPMLFSLLEHAKEIKLSGNGFEILFLKQDRFSYEMLQSTENIAFLKELAESVTSRPQTIKLTLEELSLGPPGVETIPLSGDQKKQLMERVKSDPGVKAFLDTFQGEITDVQELN